MRTRVPTRGRAFLAKLILIGFVPAWLASLAWSVDRIWIRGPQPAVSFNAADRSEP